MYLIFKLLYHRIWDIRAWGSGRWRDRWGISGRRGYGRSIRGRLGRCFSRCTRRRWRNGRGIRGRIRRCGRRGRRPRIASSYADVDSPFTLIASPVPVEQNENFTLGII